MHLVTVESSAALNATGGLWAARVGTEQVPECPPDAVLTLRFNAAVDAARLQDRLVVVDSAGAARPVTLLPDAACAPCAAVRLRLPALEVGARYRIRLPVGAEVGAHAGPTTQALEVPVMGLRPFTIPWSSPAWDQLSHTHQRIWIPHGLPESTDLQRLRAALTFQPPIGPWALERVSAAVLSVRGRFQPDVEYAIAVAPDDGLRDGFGLPLLGNGVTRRFAPLQPFLGGPRDFALVAPGAALDLRYLARGRRTAPAVSYTPMCDAAVFSARPVAASDVAGALNTLYYTCQKSDRYFQGPSVVTVGPAPADDALQDITVSGAQLYGPSGVYLQRETMVQGAWQPQCRPGYAQCRLHSKASFGVSTVTAPGHLTVWVTVLATARGLADAEVEVYEVPQRWSGQRVQSRHRVTTDSAGLAMVPTTLTGRVQVLGIDSIGYWAWQDRF